MKTPNASDFLKQWIVSANERAPDLLANWSANLKKYTAIIKDDRGCVIDKVAERLKLSPGSLSPVRADMRKQRRRSWQRIRFCS
jgi:hypothetical protein